MIDKGYANHYALSVKDRIVQELEQKVPILMLSSLQNVSVRDADGFFRRWTCALVQFTVRHRYGQVSRARCSGQRTSSDSPHRSCWRCSEGWIDDAPSRAVYLWQSNCADSLNGSFADLGHRPATQGVSLAGRRRAWGRTARLESHPGGAGE